MKVRLKIENGKLTQGKEHMAALIRSLNGEYIADFISLNEPHSIEEWRHLYFYLRDLLHESVDTGYTKKELHEEIKRHVLPTLYAEFATEEAPWIEKGKKVDLMKPTTSDLTPIGWREYVRRFKEFALEHFETYI